jgi:hypothetical protein
VCDSATEAGTRPESCKAAAELIAASSDDILLVPLGGGGIVAGIQTFLYYRDMTHSDKSVLYPIRFSRNKSKDTVPQVSPAEEEYLKEAVGRGLKPVVLDEDTAFGYTLRNAKDHFSSMFSSRVEAFYCHRIGAGLFGPSSAGQVYY